MSRFVRKINHSNCNFVHQDKTNGMQAFVHRLETLKGTSALDANGYLVPKRQYVKS